MRQEAPGVSGLAFFKLMPEFRRHTLQTFAGLARQHGDIVRFRGLWTSFMLMNPQHIEYVLQTNNRNYRKGKDYQELKASTGEGLFVSEGETWQRQRRLAQPAFHRQRIAAFAKIMTDSTEAMLERWQLLAAENRSFEIGAEMMRLTLGIVGKALFSRDLSDEADAMNEAFEVIRTHTVHRMMSVIKLPRTLPTPRNLRFRRSVATVDCIVDELIAERRRSNDRPRDLLSMLMEAQDEATGERMSDKQLRDEAKTLIGAGYETTTQALTWTWYLLAKHRDVEAKLHAELEKVLGGRTPVFEDLPNLKYTLMIFEEAMRLYPPAWVISRAAIGDDEIGGYYIPPDAEVLMFPYLTHRHPEFWGEPEAFNPERFAPEQAATRPRFAYFPFGGGARSCIGNNFALMEAQLIIATIAQQYRLRMSSEQMVEPEPSVTLRPRGGILMTLH